MKYLVLFILGIGAGTVLCPILGMENMQGVLVMLSTIYLFTLVCTFLVGLLAMGVAKGVITAPQSFAEVVKTSLSWPFQIPNWFNSCPMK